MTSGKQILIVDDEPSMRANIVDLLASDGYRLWEAGDPDEAMAIAAERQLDLVLLDINLPKRDGIAVLHELKQLRPDLPVIVFTAFGTSERAISAMKAGAYDYLEKPFELEEFKIIVRRSLDYSSLLSEVQDLRTKLRVRPPEDDLAIIGKSARMNEIFKLIGLISTVDAAVLITGSSGTGKELIADAIQRHSARRDMPYVKVNCGAFSESVLESEIFGHEKGSFTGAIAQRQGKFELAHQGTLFLDEVSSMPPSLQVRLLRVLEHKSFFRLGGEKPITVDVRVIAATNRKLDDEVHAGRFREDLFFRLKVVRIDLPPLRDRLEDLPLLVKHFLQKYAPDRRLVIPPEELHKLRAYHWPGNVRELENVILSAVVTAREDILTFGSLVQHPAEVDDDTLLDQQLSRGLSMHEVLAAMEKKMILRALKRADWNRTEAAKLLNIHRRLLYSKMQEYGITPGRSRD